MKVLPPCRALTIESHAVVAAQRTGMIPMLSMLEEGGRRWMQDAEAGEVQK